MGPIDVYAGEGPELRALREREARGEALSDAERRRFAELILERLEGVVAAGRLARSGTVAEIDQLVAATRDMASRIEALGEADGFDALMGPSPEVTAQLACNLLRAAESVVCYAGLSWGPAEFADLGERLSELQEDLAWHVEYHAELEAEFAAEEARSDGGGA